MKRDALSKQLGLWSRRAARGVAIVSAITTLIGAAWGLIEFALTSQKQREIARVAQLTSYKSFGELLRAYHAIEKQTDDFMKQTNRRSDWDCDSLINEYGSGASIYYAEQFKALRASHEFYEELGTLIRFRAVDFDVVFETITFPSDVQLATGSLQKCIAEHWFKLRTPHCLPDFGANLRLLQRNFEARRGNPKSEWTIYKDQAICDRTK